jgi:hypothetical protein
MAQAANGAGRDHWLEHDPGAGRAGQKEHDGIGAVRPAALNLDPASPNLEGLAHYPFAK